MIINKNNDFKTCSKYPDTDWENKNNYIIDETTEKGKELFEKVLELYPCFKVVSDSNNNVLDIVLDKEKQNEISKEKEKENKIKCNEVCFEKFKIETDFYIMLLENKVSSLENKLNKILEVK